MLSETAVSGPIQARGRGRRCQCPPLRRLSAGMMTGEAAPAAVSRADVEDAQRLLAGVCRVTPMQESRLLSSKVGGPVLLKCENLQRTGSFKLRGAYVRIARLSKAERSRGVVAASAGNHAQGVALAAQLLGIKSTGFMPHGAPIPKEEATRAYGAG